MLLKTLFFFTVLLGLFFSLPEPLFSQCASLQAKISEWKEKREERIERRNYEKERERLIQAHINRQAPEVQERMKQDEKDRQRLYRKRKGAFYKRWFKKIRKEPFFKRQVR